MFVIMLDWYDEHDDDTECFLKPEHLYFVPQSYDAVKFFEKVDKDYETWEKVGKPHNIYVFEGFYLRDWECFDPEDVPPFSTDQQYLFRNSCDLRKRHGEYDYSQDAEPINDFGKYLDEKSKNLNYNIIDDDDDVVYTLTEKGCQYLEQLKSYNRYDSI